MDKIQQVITHPYSLQKWKKNAFSSKQEERKFKK